MKNSSIFVAAIAFFFAAISSASAQDQPTEKTVQEKQEVNKFDGKMFEVTMIEKGKETGRTDTLVFQQNTFESTRNRKSGFEKTAYKTGMENRLPKFETQVKNGKDQMVMWKGVMNNNEIKGTSIWVTGKNVVLYNYKGKLLE